MKHFLLAVIVCSFLIGTTCHAVKPAKYGQLTASLLLDEQHRYQIPLPMASQLGILQTVPFDEKTHIYFLEEWGNLDPNILELVVQILDAAYVLPQENQDLKAVGSGEKFLNAVTQAAQLGQKITPESLLQLSDYLNFPLGVYLATNMLLHLNGAADTIARTFKTSEAAKIAGTLLMDQSISQDTYDLFAKLVSLHSTSIKTGVTLNLVSQKAYQYSVRDYLDFRPNAITITNAPTENGYYINLSRLNLVSLDGLSDVPHINEALAINARLNALTALHAHEFAAASNLKTLYLRRNRIQEVDEKALADLFNLQTIELRYNLLTHIYPKIFENNRSLEFIDLSDNKLRYIDANTFKKITRLNSVELDGNEIKDINPDMFNQLPYVVVTLNKNPLSDATKKTISKWNEEHAREWVRGEHIETSPFIEIEGHEYPPRREI